MRDLTLPRVCAVEIVETLNVLLNPGAGFTLEEYQCAGEFLTQLLGEFIFYVEMILEVKVVTIYV